MTSWKQAERRAARLFGTKRTPLSGGNSGGTRSDSQHARFFVETKQRKRHAVWSLYEDTKVLAVKEDKIPVLVLDQVRKHGSLICIHSSDIWEFVMGVLLEDPDRAKKELDSSNIS